MGERIPAPHAWQVTLHRWWGAGEEGDADAGADADADADAHGAWQTAGEGAREGAAPPTHTHGSSVCYVQKHSAGCFFSKSFLGVIIYFLPEARVCA